MKIKSIIIIRYTLGEPVTWIPIDMGDHLNGAPCSICDLGSLYNHSHYIKRWSMEDPRLCTVAKACEPTMPESGTTDFPCSSTLLFTPNAGLNP